MRRYFVINVLSYRWRQRTSSLKTQDKTSTDQVCSLPTRTLVHACTPPLPVIGAKFLIKFYWLQYNSAVIEFFLVRLKAVSKCVNSSLLCISTVFQSFSTVFSGFWEQSPQTQPTRFCIWSPLLDIRPPGPIFCTNGRTMATPSRWNKVLSHFLYIAYVDLRKAWQLIPCYWKC